MINFGRENIIGKFEIKGNLPNLPIFPLLFCATWYYVIDHLTREPESVVDNLHYTYENIAMYSRNHYKHVNNFRLL